MEDEHPGHDDSLRLQDHQRRSNAAGPIIVVRLHHNSKGPTSSNQDPTRPHQ